MFIILFSAKQNALEVMRTKLLESSEKLAQTMNEVEQKKREIEMEKALNARYNHEIE